jgi:hypothetical protein
MLGHTNGPFGSLVVLVYGSVTGVRCHSEERSNAHEFKRHRINRSVRMNDGVVNLEDIA